MLDFDLAELYEVPTKALNQAVKRNIARFPRDFMFQLTKEEWTFLLEEDMRSQIVTSSQKKRKIGLIPYAFTEQGVTILANDRLGKIYVAIETLLTEKETQKTWEERERIGFR